MNDFISLLAEWILSAKWPRRILLGGILAVILAKGGLETFAGWIGLGVVGGVLIFLEALDGFIARQRKAGRGRRGGS